MNANAICGYLWLVWWLAWLVWAFQSKKTRQRESIASRLTYTFIAWLAMYTLLSARGLGSWLRLDVLPYHAWMGWLGVAITALGFVLTLWARFTLGSNWSGTVTIKVDHELIRTGPYRYVRHPIYTGIIIALAGTALARNQWRGVVAVLLLWIAFTIKRLKEEQFMRQTFGAQYTDYAHTTGAIFPLLLRRNP
jgi:protein-S-isoprenylcysteine O-methyltransferase Ste14